MRHQMKCMFSLYILLYNISPFIRDVENDHQQINNDIVEYIDNEVYDDIVFVMSVEEKEIAREFLGRTKKPLEELFNLNENKIKHYWNHNVNKCCNQNCFDHFTYSDFGRCR